MIAFTVIGGYLGAGKTTLLNHMLKFNQGKKIGLLINDFGQINIDAALIESRTENQINLTNGCVCCTLVDGFHVAIDQLCEIRPHLDQIVVEASGVADVHNLAQYGRGPGCELDGVLVVADAETVIEKAKDKYVASTIRRQLAAADLILLNKIDLLDDATLAQRLAWLKSEYPGASIIETSFANVPVELLLGIHDSGKELSEHQPFEAYQRGEHAHYSTWQYKSNEAVSRSSLEHFLSGLDDSVLRAKGIARLSDGETLALQVVGSRRELNQINCDNTGLKMVAIGLKGQLDAEFLELLAENSFHSRHFSL